MGFGFSTYIHTYIYNQTHENKRKGGTNLTFLEQKDAAYE